MRISVYYFANKHLAASYEVLGDYCWSKLWGIYPPEIKLPKNTPLANVWLTLLQQTEINIDTFSHSTNTVPQLLV